MPVPEAELQATANLSPVSPSPVHAAPSLAVPALQDTVDTIDAMVAAAAAAAAVAPNDGGVNEPNVPDPAVMNDNGDDVVDDDSFNDAYGEETSQPDPETQNNQQQADTNDDYAKTFDSPIEPEEGEDEDQDQPESAPAAHSPKDSSSSEGGSKSATEQPAQGFTEAAPPNDQVSGSSATPSAVTDVVAAPIVQTADASETPDTLAMSSQPPALASASAPAPADITSPAMTNDANATADIQQLVASLTSQPSEPSISADQQGTTTKTEASSDPSSQPSSTLPSPSSLPPRPPLPQTASQTYIAQNPAGTASSVPINPNVPPGAGQAPAYVAAGAPGTAVEGYTNLPPPPAVIHDATTGMPSMNPMSYPSQAPSYSFEPPQDSYQRQWDQFMSDERQYMSEAKWDRFPEGSRLFIGNLSSDKVSKRDVFDIFHRFGRLAQISLKSAYGFVQYHTIEEGRAAMENLQGIEIKGRRIHLEISRVQDKSKKERGRNNDEGRGRDGGRRGDRFGNQSRDDYRPGRNHSPRRNDYHGRDDGYGRERGYDSGRGRRSRSPGFGRDKDSYRRRSPSPYGRSQADNELDLPRRYGADVPDVQMILQPDVSRDFVNWVENAFKAKGLKTEVMYLHPRMPKDQVIQRQAAEGVHAVVDLDVRAQSMGKIPVQAFDRSAGTSNVRFDQYVDLDPGTAAEVILRAKASGAANYGQHQQQQYGSAPAGYGNHYGGQQHPQQTPYAGGQHQPGPYPPAPPPQQQQAPHQPAIANADIARLVGQVDNATLQQILSSIQPNAQGVGAPAGMAHGAAAPAANPQVDIQAILGSLNPGAQAQQQQHHHHQAHAPPPPQAHAQYGAAGYNAQPVPGAPQPASNGDSAAHVQNIMAQLARYRQ